MIDFAIRTMLNPNQFKIYIVNTLNKLVINLALGFSRICSWIPMPIVNGIATVLGRLAYYLLRNRRNIALVNLQLCFPEKSNQALTVLLKQHFAELVRFSLMYGLIFYASPRKLRRLVKVRGYENFAQFNGRRPVIYLAPHFLGLDIGANRLTLETPGYSIYATQRNSYLTQRIKEARLRFIKDKGGEIFSRQEGLRTIVRKMKQTRIPFYYLPDQDMDARDSVYVPFFAHPTCATLATLPKLIKLTGAAVVPMATYREGNHFVVELFPAWNDTYPTGNEITDVTTMNRYLETMIMKYPAQYLWLHKRFKTQPNLRRGKLYENC